VIATRLTIFSSRKRAGLSTSLNHVDTGGLDSAHTASTSPQREQRESPRVSITPTRVVTAYSAPYDHSGLHKRSRIIHGSQSPIHLDSSDSDPDQRVISLPARKEHAGRSSPPWHECHPRDFSLRVVSHRPTLTTSAANGADTTTSTIAHSHNERPTRQRARANLYKNPPQRIDPHLDAVLGRNGLLERAREREPGQDGSSNRRNIKVSSLGGEHEQRKQLGSGTYFAGVGEVQTSAVALS